MSARDARRVLPAVARTDGWRTAAGNRSRVRARVLRRRRGSSRRRWSRSAHDGRRRQDRGDRVLNRLAEQQPLISPEWEQWTINRREVPLAGTWTVSAHEVGRGDDIGTAIVTRTAADKYDVVWDLQFADGSRWSRTGKDCCAGAIRGAAAARSPRLVVVRGARCCCSTRIGGASRAASSRATTTSSGSTSSSCATPVCRACTP